MKRSQKPANRTSRSLWPTVTESTLLINNAAEIVIDPREDILEGPAAIVFCDGRVTAVGPNKEILREHPPENADEVIDASGRTVLPGLVDSHTHAVFGGDRSDEFEAKLRGKTYQEIAAEGGGILRTVQATRQATKAVLRDRLLAHLDVMVAHGTTTVEVKSGYGLNRETELQLLEVIAEADERHPATVVPTFMGAHTVPADVDGDEYTQRVIEEQLPAVEKQGIAEFCDVFCEGGAFTPDQSRRILEAGVEYGLKPKIHAEEFERTGGAIVAADQRATSADHLLCASAQDIDALVESDVIPVLLPGTAFVLGEAYADARAFLEAGAPVALATDFNPNCHSRSLAMVLALACVNMKMTPREALAGVTVNASRAIDRPATHGTLTDGETADAVLVDAPSYRHVPYSFGENLVRTVVIDGEVVHRPSAPIRTV